MKKLILISLLLALLALTASCVSPQGATEGQQGFDWTLIIFLVLIFAAFYFLMVRPQRKRQKEHETMVQQIQKGDQVISAGGIYGTVDSISEDSIVIKIESGATMRVAKGSVVGRRTK